MMQYLIIFGLFFLAFSIFSLSLYFSKYKRRPEDNCCGGGHCSVDMPRNGHHARVQDADHVCCKES
jgi:hypothetical protein